MITVICQVDGGLGKSIMFTAVLKAIKKQYKKANIIVGEDIYSNSNNSTEFLEIRNKVTHEQ